MKPNLKRNRTLQRTPTLASLFCELRAQRPDLALKWRKAEAGVVMSPVTEGRTVAAEFGDRVLVRSGRQKGVQGLWFFSPLLAKEVFTSRATIFTEKEVTRKAA